MNIKSFNNFFPIALILLLSGCTKKRDAKQANRHFKQAFLAFNASTNGSYEKAIKLLDRAIRLDKNPKYYAMKATILMKLGRNEQAEDAFEDALDASPEPKEECSIRNNYACLLAQTGREKRAIGMWDRLKNSPHYETAEVALFNQGKVLMGMGDYVMAKNKFFSATLHSPEYVDAHFYLAVVADQYLKDYELARKEAKQVLFLEPEHEAAKSLLQSLSKKQNVPTGGGSI